VNTSAFTIRQLSHPDLPRVIAIERRAFPTPWSLSMFVLELSKPSGIHLTAINDDHMLGYVICARYDETFHIMNIATDPDHRRQGVGSALLEAVVGAAGHDASFTLEVRVSNAAAIGLYKRYGFQAVGTRRRYYADNGEDAIIMWRALGQPWET